MKFTTLRRFTFFLLRRFLLLWVRSESIDSNVLGASDHDCLNIYVLQQPAMADLVVLDNECRKLGLSRPTKAINQNGFISSSSFFYLRPGATWVSRKHSNYIAPLISSLLTSVSCQQIADVRIIPVNVFWGLSPDRETSAWKLLLADSWEVSGRIRRFFQVIFLGHKTRLQFGSPLLLSQLLAENKDAERTARMLHRLLRVHFRNSKTAAIGPDLSHRRTLVRSLVQVQQVQQAILATAKQQNITFEKASQRALRYGNEIASDYGYSAIRFLELVLGWFWNRFYDGIKVNNLDELRSTAQGHALIYVPCHRSHIDYLLLSYVLFTNGLTPPHIAAGINLNLPIIGGILRRGGAFFMRRSFRDNQLYAAVFNAYLQALYSKGFPVEFFVEGGRSRTGRTLQPKTGMLNMTINCYLRSYRLPIVFVPVYIGYERVLESRTYLGELRGQSKKKESFFDVFRVLASIRKQRFGQVAVNFGQPLQLSEFLDQQHANWQHSLPDADWVYSASKQLGHAIARKINAAAAVNQVNLVAMALLSAQRLALDEPTLIRVVDVYLQLLRSVPYSSYASLPEQDAASMVRQVHDMELITRQEDSLGSIYFAQENQAVLLTYYRNNVVHIFALPALLASFFYSNTQMTHEQILLYCRALYPYLQAELFIDFSDDELEQQIEHWLQALLAMGLLEQCTEGYRRPAPSSREFVQLSLLAKAITQTLQRYYMAIALLLDAGQKKTTAAELEHSCTVMAQRLSILHGLNAPEFFDKSLFRNFIATLLEQDVLHQDEQQLLSYHPRLRELAEGAAKLVLPAEVRLSIKQVTVEQAPTVLAENTSQI